MSFFIYILFLPRKLFLCYTDKRVLRYAGAVGPPFYRLGRQSRILSISLLLYTELTLALMRGAVACSETDFTLTVDFVLRNLTFVTK